MPKVRTANTTDHENTENNNHECKNKTNMMQQSKEEKIMEKQRKPCNYCHKLFHTEDQCWAKYPNTGPRNWRKWNNGHEQHRAYYQNYERERYNGNRDEHNFHNRSQRQMQNF